MKRLLVVLLASLAVFAAGMLPAKASTAPKGHVVTTPEVVRWTGGQGEGPASTNCYNASRTTSYVLITTVFSYSLRINWCFKDNYGITSYSFNDSYWDCCSYQFEKYAGKTVSGGIGQPSVSEYHQAWFHECFTICGSDIGLWNRMTGYGIGWDGKGGQVT